MSDQPRRIGRPPLSADERGEPVSVRLPASTYVRLVEVADRRQQDISVVIRHAIDRELSTSS